jgi:hypothetical protein
VPGLASRTRPRPRSFKIAPDSGSALRSIGNFPGRNREVHPEPISEQDAAILEQQGHKVVRDGSGTPYLEGSATPVIVTQPAELEAKPTQWLPGPSEQPAQPAPVSAPPPAPSEDPDPLAPPEPETEGVDKPAGPAKEHEPVDPMRLSELLKGRPKDFRDRVSFDPKLGDNGATLPNGKAKLGPSAFTSEAQLKSTLDHEQKHVEQLTSGRFPKDKDHLGAVAVSQIEAYRTELEYLRRYDPQYYKQVQNGNYELRPEDAAPIPSK